MAVNMFLLPLRPTLSAMALRSPVAAARHSIPIAPASLLHQLPRRTFSSASARAPSSPLKYSATPTGLIVASSLLATSAWLAFRSKSTISCQPAVPPPPPQEDLPALSSLAPRTLAFGTVAGICAGIFLKKGLKALAFLLGGVFVLLQYLGSIDILSTDWKRVSRTYDALTSSSSGGGGGGLDIARAWGWVVDFLTRDFQGRATFVAGLMLGLRIG